MEIHEKNFEEIYKSTYSNVLKFIVLKSYDFSNVNDILQDTYVELLNKIKKSKRLEIEKPDSYICGIAENIIKRNYFSKKLEIVPDEFDENIEGEDLSNIDEDFINKENVKKVWNYLEEKDSLTTKIFYLYFVEDMKIVEIAKELQISESNVKHKLYRTINEIKKRKDVMGYAE